VRVFLALRDGEIVFTQVLPKGDSYALVGYPPSELRLPARRHYRNGST